MRMVQKYSILYYKPRKKKNILIFCIMDSKKEISSRFIEAYNTLLSVGLTADKKDFAKKIGISPSLVTEISKGRSAVGTTAIQSIVSVFSLSARWLLTGEGEMIEKKDKVEITSDKEQQLLDIITSQQQTIASLTKILDSREKEKSAADALQDATAECAAAAGK